MDQRRYIAFLVLTLLLWTAQSALPADAASHGFIGVEGCKICHKSEKSGNQYGIWLASGHAKAYETLGTPAAKEAAAKLGLSGNPQEMDQCLGCHVTGHGVEKALLGEKYSITEGVGCESCHGAGADYKSKKVMEDHAASVAAGMIVPTAETCKTCHNEKSPSYKPFDFEKFYAKIAHPTPKSE